MTQLAPKAIPFLNRADTGFNSAPTFVAQSGGPEIRQLGSDDGGATRSRCRGMFRCQLN